MSAATMFLCGVLTLIFLVAPLVLAGVYGKLDERRQRLREPDGQG